MWSTIVGTGVVALCAAWFSLAAAQTVPTLLTIALANEPDDLDLHINFGVQPSRVILAGNVIERLVRTDEAGVPEPVLAESWERVDPLRWRFTLRQGAMFHDGTPFTAADVVASVMRVLDPAVGARFTNKLASLNGAVAVDDYTVDLTTGEPDTLLLNRLSYLVIMSARQMAEQPDQIKTRPIGTGPYRFVSWDRGTSIEIAEFDGYWGEDRDLPETVRYVWRTEPSVRLAALQAGEVDAALALPPNLAALAPRSFWALGTEHVLLRLNTFAAPTDSLDVRKALAMVINREGIIEGVLQGAAALTGTAVASEGAAIEYRASFDHPIPYDVAAGTAAVRSLGAGGTPLRVIGPADGPWFNMRDVSEAVAAMLTAAGFTVDLQLVPFQQWVENLYWQPDNKANGPHVMIIPAGTDLLTLDQPYRAYLTCGQILSLYCNPEVEALYANLAAAPDVESRVSILAEVSEIAVNRDSAVVPIATLRTYISTQAGMTAIVRPVFDVFVWDFSFEDR